jgi:drug/metabolite transporter (DMT)-like permease
VRRSLVGVIGTTLIVLGVALVVLPGPFTLPLLVAGFAVLSSEFAWAGVVLARARRGAGVVAATARRGVAAVRWRPPPAA